MGSRASPVGGTETAVLLEPARSGGAREEMTELCHPSGDSLVGSQSGPEGMAVLLEERMGGPVSRQRGGRAEALEREVPGMPRGSQKATGLGMTSKDTRRET